MQLVENSKFNELSQHELGKIDGGWIPLVIAAAKGAAWTAGALTGATGLYFSAYKVGQHISK